MLPALGCNRSLYDAAPVRQVLLRQEHQLSRTRAKTYVTASAVPSVSCRAGAVPPSPRPDRADVTSRYTHSMRLVMSAKPARGWGRANVNSGHHTNGAWRRITNRMPSEAPLAIRPRSMA